MITSCTWEILFGITLEFQKATFNPKTLILVAKLHKKGKTGV